MEMVSERGFSRSRAGDGPLVADRNRRARDGQSLWDSYAAHQAGLGRRGDARVRGRNPHAEGNRCAPNEKGLLVITRPFPGLTPTIWNDPERYGRDYWSQIPGTYFTGDAAHLDEDGYIWFSGRADDIIKIAGHRIGTVEVETAFLEHPAVAESGVTGRPDDLRGEVLAVFVALKPGYKPSPELAQE